MEKIWKILHDVYNYLDTSSSVGLSGFMYGALPHITTSSFDNPTSLVIDTLYNGFLGSFQSYFISFLTMNEFRKLISIIFIMGAIRKTYVLHSKQNKNDNGDENGSNNQKVIEMSPFIKITIIR